MRRVHSGRERFVLVLGHHATSLSSLAERTRELGYRVIRAKTPVDALELAKERGYQFDTVLFEPSLPVADLEGALARLREQARSRELVFIATGERPDAESREKLRRAGVDLALWEPVGNHALRFQLNRALAGKRDGWLRSNPRVPTEMPVRIWSAGREKRASIYSLSSGGAFLETRRPCLTGADVGIELPLPSGTAEVAGRVVYTNVPGNLHSTKLPDGMGIRFTETPAAAYRAILHTIAEQTALFVM